MMYGIGFSLTGLAACKPPQTGATTQLVLSGLTVAENGAGGELIGTLSISGPGFTGPVAYSITSDTSLNFEISGAGNDELRVKAGVSFDRETQASFVVGLKGVDSLLVEFTKMVSVIVTNVNEAPTDITLSANSIPENTVPGSVIGTLSTTDVDVGETHTYTIDLDADGKFAISGDNLTVRAGASFDFETFTSHAVTVRSTDVGGLFVTAIKTINITDVNEAPTDIALSGTTVADNAADGSVIGVVSGTDPDAGDTLTFAIAPGGDPSGNFELVGADFRVKTGNTLDNAVNASHNVTLRVTDAGSLTFDEQFTIAVTAGSTVATPITIVANAHWYQKGVGVTEGTGTQQWDDQGPNAKHLTQGTGASQPAYNSTTGAIAFDGVDDFLANTTVPMSGTDVHVFLVAALKTGGDAYGQYIGWDSSNANTNAKPKLLIRNNLTTQAWDYENAIRAVTALGLIDGVIKSIHSEVAAGTADIIVNGVSAPTTGTVTTPLLGDGLVVGGTGGFVGQMDAYEIVYVTEAMTAQQITDMETYMAGVRDAI